MTLEGTLADPCEGDRQRLHNWQPLLFVLFGPSYSRAYSQCVSIYSVPEGRMSGVETPFERPSCRREAIDRMTIACVCGSDFELLVYNVLGQWELMRRRTSDKRLVEVHRGSSMADQRHYPESPVSA